MRRAAARLPRPEAPDQADEDDEGHITAPAAVERGAEPEAHDAERAFDHGADSLNAVRCTGFSVPDGARPAKGATRTLAGVPPPRLRPVRRALTWAASVLRATVRAAWRASGWYWRRTTRSCGRESPRIIDGEDDFDLVGRAADLPELLELIEETTPDVVVTDIRMPPTGTDEGIQAASWLREHKPEVGVVVLSQYKTPSYALALLETGSAGRAYLLKEQVAGADELAQAIRTVAQSGSMIDPQIVDELIEAKSSRRKSDLSWLTPRESEILGEMAKGKSNAAIASSLQVSERAVEKHTNSIFSKLGLTEERDVNRRVKAVLVYLSDPGGG